MLKRLGSLRLQCERMSDSPNEKVSKTSQPSHDSENVTSAKDLLKAEKKKGAKEPLYLTRYE
jgi:hypothetical protein